MKIKGRQRIESATTNQKRIIDIAHKGQNKIQNVVLFIYGPLCNTNDFGHWVDWKYGFNICPSKNERNSGKIRKYLAHFFKNNIIIVQINY